MTSKAPSRRRRGSFRWVKMIALVFLTMGLFRIGSQLIEYRNLKDQLTVYEDKLSVVTAAYDESQQKLALLEDKSYVQRIARDKLGMIQEGECVVMTMKPVSVDVAAQ